MRANIRQNTLYIQSDKAIKGMEMNNFAITKRDGSKEAFSLDKIMNAILKAFNSVNEPINLGAISKILSHLDIQDGVKVEDIRTRSRRRS